jgi:GT2 family glycosyltransferase
VAIAEIDLADKIRDMELPPSPGGRPYRSMWLLVSCGGDPRGVVLVPAENGRASTPAIQGALARQLGFSAREPDVHGPSLPSGTRPSITVVLTTCAQPARAARCVTSVLEGEVEPLEILVVDNRPGKAATAELLGRQFAAPKVRCIDEHRRGLSAARNAGLHAASGEVVAFTDDDVVADRRWVRAISERFARPPNATCVTGPVLPLELETDAQLFFEGFGPRGSGFERHTYSLAQPPPDDPLFPYAAGRFGAGANLAVRTEAMRALGGFDPNLGTGTPSRGGEDLDLFIRILRSGGAITSEPAALVWHAHPRTSEEMRERAFGYGVGLTAALAKHALLRDGRGALLRRIPAAARYTLDPRSPKNAGRSSRYPASLTRTEYAGMLLGPCAYARTRLRRKFAP